MTVHPSTKLQSVVAWILATVAIFAMAVLPGCGKDQKDVPKPSSNASKKVTSTPNTEDKGANEESDIKSGESVEGDAGNSSLELETAVTSEKVSDTAEAKDSESRTNTESSASAEQKGASSDLKSSSSSDSSSAASSSDSSSASSSSSTTSSSTSGTKSSGSSGAPGAGHVGDIRQAFVTPQLFVKFWTDCNAERDRCYLMTHFSDGVNAWSANASTSWCSGVEVMPNILAFNYLSGEAARPYGTPILVRVDVTATDGRSWHLIWYSNNNNFACAPN